MADKHLSVTTDMHATTEELVENQQITIEKLFDAVSST
jgi:hypothetical protein